MNRYPKVNPIACSFTLPISGMSKYRLQAVKIGYIKDGTANILKTIPITVSGTTRFVTTSPVGITAPEWNDYFTDAGRAKYGTSIWVQDAFGNGNVFNSIVLQ